MTKIPGPHGDVELDGLGYLVDGTVWTRELAAVLAARDGLRRLTPDHWRLIEALRAHHEEHGGMPKIRELCRASGFSLQRIYELFPKGPAQDACRIAGLPRPESCV